MLSSSHISSTQPETAMGWCARRTGGYLAALVVTSSLRTLRTLDTRIKPASATPCVRPNAQFNEEVGS